MPWIDTHAHLDAAELDEQRPAMLGAMRQAGVLAVIPAVAPVNFAAVRDLARAAGHAYALGVHPLFVGDLDEQRDFAALRAAVESALGDPRFVAIGEIGLDGFVPGVDPMLQRRWLDRQLALAREFGLPVLLHVRRAQDQVLAALRRQSWGARGAGGIAHAFNGSRQQADACLAQGLRLGFGGAMTFERALNIRRLAAGLADGAIVLETDSPDIPPAWLDAGPNSPTQLPRIGAVLADLRGVGPEEIAASTSAAACAALPRLAALVESGA